LANELKEKLKEQLNHLEDRKKVWRKRIELMGHHLVNVREGALLGFGLNTDVSLLEKLYWKRKETEKPWFRHAAYRAIDEILLNIESIGKQKEFYALQSLFDRLQEREGKNLHAGVQTRMEWSIARLKERAGKTLESKK